MATEPVWSEGVGIETLAKRLLTFYRSRGLTYQSTTYSRGAIPQPLLVGLISRTATDNPG